MLRDIGNNIHVSRNLPVVPTPCDGHCGLGKGLVIRAPTVNGSHAETQPCSQHALVPFTTFWRVGTAVHNFWQAQFTTPRPRFTTQFTAFGWETNLHDKICWPTSIFGRYPFWEGVLSLAPLPLFIPFLITATTIPPPPTAHMRCRHR